MQPPSVDGSAGQDSSPRVSVDVTADLTPCLDVAIVAGVRFDTSEPHAGGLERHTDVLATSLQKLGHRVTVFAGAGEPPAVAGRTYAVEALVNEPIVLSELARSDVSMPSEQFMVEHDAYLDLSVRLRERRFDVVHNNSLHYLPVLDDGRHPTLHTLHTPPTPWLESAHRIGRRRRQGRTMTVSVSHDNASRWPGVVDRVIHNGVDLTAWHLGQGGGGYAFWSGRLVPEKGVHLAIAAARAAGIRLLIAGPVHDSDYFDKRLVPEFGPDCVYVGHCTRDDTARYLRDADVALVTPCWDEPFGLVVAEALACGTPIAAFDRGALSELLCDGDGVLAGADDPDALAGAIQVARGLDRSACRAAAEARFSADEMARRYVDAYDDLITAARVAC